MKGVGSTENRQTYSTTEGSWFSRQGTGAVSSIQGVQVQFLIGHPHLCIAPPVSLTKSHKYL